MIRVETIPEFEKSLKRLSKKYPSLKNEYADFVEKTENKAEISNIDRKYLDSLIDQYF